MAEQIVQCPHCPQEVKVEVDMYFDSGDVCYDLMVDEAHAVEIEDLSSPTRYTCQSCKKEFQLELDNEFWGSINIPITAEIV